MPQKISAPTKTSAPKKTSHRKKPIPQKLRQEVWLRQFGEVFGGKCPVQWCSQHITVFGFEAGHNIPESKGGATTLSNLIPICSGCNRGMGDTYTIEQWNLLHDPPKPRKLPMLPVQRPVQRPEQPPPTKIKPPSFWARFFCRKAQAPLSSITTIIGSQHSQIRYLFTNELSVAPPEQQ